MMETCMNIGNPKATTTYVVYFKMEHQFYLDISCEIFYIIVGPCDSIWKLRQVYDFDLTLWWLLTTTTTTQNNGRSASRSRWEARCTIFNKYTLARNTRTEKEALPNGTFLKNGQSGPLFRLFSVFSNKFYNK